MSALHFAFTLRLYGYVLQCLSDHDFTGLDLFYRIKDCWKRRQPPHDLLIKPLERGLSTKIGEWCFSRMFDVDGASESSSTAFIKTLDGEQLLWFLEDVAIAAKQSDAFKNSEIVKALAATIKQIQDLGESDENAYWSKIEGDGSHELVDLFSKLCRTERQELARMGEPYVSEISDRILHDRQLCYFIAQTVMEIGFDGEQVDGLRVQWVARASWPTRVKEILIARDRGKCASCGVDMTMELKGKSHIDHMFALSVGGCNDLVNLQLLCSTCNQQKASRDADVKTSVPGYVRR